MIVELPYTIRDYIFKKEIGKGGFSRVYLVESIKYSTNFVAKVMIVNEAEQTRRWETFESEIEALQRLDSPHIIRLYDHFIENGVFYLILEYCPNGSVQDEIEQHGELQEDRFCMIGRQVIDGLLYCHSRNIAHHDIKPHNILIDQFGRAKIADFGLSLRMSKGTLSDSFAGSLVFTAPEIFLKKSYDPFKADVWSLGVTFAVMITGEVPWAATSVERLKQLVKSGHYFLKNRPPAAIAELIRNMIVVDPLKRMSLEDIRNSKVFTENLSRVVSTETIADPLSPRGRLLSPRMSSQYQMSWMKSFSPFSFIGDDSDDRARYKSLLIGSANIIGYNKPLKLKKRMHPIPDIVSFRNK